MSDSMISTIPMEPIAWTRPNILSLVEFEGADLFGPERAEELFEGDAEAALEVMLENSPLADTRDVLKLLDGEVLATSISAYKRMPVEDFYRKAWPEGLVDYLRENFGEEHANQNGEDGLSDADAIELRRRMQETVDWYLERVKSYPCEVVRTWHFDNADLRELVEQLRPEWLDPR